MIRFSLKCKHGHIFDSWFRSDADFGDLNGAGRVTCPDCGTSAVKKAPMAPSLSGKAEATEHPIAKLRRKIEAEADYVGDRFAAEARAIRDGDAADRPIWGQAKISDAKALHDDGIPAIPLPFGPKSKAN
ncbi:hypothetical protein PARPLA_02646 [Rhodobacteraceae bacterium THAF1]|uniref:DUF1178 family protein n=1 Tax=Palleronia sp. THAF1 TaxID=2587842 RepID=UPI000F40E18E|nr:DUF1178 family protein [Palleronia sp. THAF1]QFU08124.1 hypothetical protein FIU81_05505 [Palleronia sp. THAF1]VDC27991.1 hypothetical protein PARPLA_02646 [Rhodobacteraceae bacterium THAF1]